MASGSNSEPKEGPSFFKVVRYPSAPQLFLPNAFVRTHLGKIPKNPIIKSKTGERSWRVTFKKSGEEYCFANGWDELAKDAQLCIRDIAVFTLTDPSTFRVSFFDSEGCDKDLPSNKTSCDNEVTPTPKPTPLLTHTPMPMPMPTPMPTPIPTPTPTPTPDEDLAFQKRISLKTSMLGMPWKFVQAAGLENKKSIRIRNNEGEEFILGLMTQKNDMTTKYYLSAGWLLFRRHHDLSDGDICLFEFLKEEGVLSLCQVIKIKSPRNQEIPTMVVDEGNRKRGRPLLLKSSPPAAASDVKIKTEDEPCPSIEKPRGFVKVKIEEESEAEEMSVKIKSGRSLCEKPAGGSGGFLEVKTEEQNDVVKRKRGRPCVYKTGAEADRLFRDKQVIYF